MTTLGRTVRTLAGALLALLVLATPAAADPPGPTNFTSEVVGIEPATDGIEVEVLGGDAFLQLRNDGHEVLVPGYDGEEEYLRFEPDGSVFVNVRSNTNWQNSDRYGVSTATVPDDVGADLPPRWEQVSSGGTWAWHDHRIHWMSPQTLPSGIDPTVEAAQEATTWPVDVVVDGTPVQVTGTLTWLPDRSPLLAFVGLLGGLLLPGLAGRRSTRAGVIVGVGTGVVLTGVVGLAGIVGLAPGVDGEPLPLVLTGIAAVVAVAGLAMQGATMAGGVVAGAAGIPLVVWALTNLGGVTAPVVPPAVLPTGLVRVVVGLAAGVGLATVVVGVRDLFGQPLGDDVEPGHVDLASGPAWPRSGGR